MSNSKSPNLLKALPINFGHQQKSDLKTYFSRKDDKQHFMSVIDDLLQGHYWAFIALRGIFTHVLSDPHLFASPTQGITKNAVFDLMSDPEVIAIFTEVRQDSNRSPELFRIRGFWNNPDDLTFPGESRPNARLAQATIRSWNEDWRGTADESIYRTFRHHIATAEASAYANTSSLVQSSGTGKSRALDKLSTMVWTVPLNLNKSTTGYPLPDIEVRDWFRAWIGKLAGLDPNTRELHFQYHAHSFFCALFQVLSETLDSKKLTTPKALHDFFAPPQDMPVSEARNQFYKNVVDRAKGVSSV